MIIMFMKKVKTPSNKDLIQEELFKAKSELAIAKDNFDNADKKYTDIAIQGLQAADLKLDCVFKKAKIMLN